MFLILLSIKTFFNGKRYFRQSIDVSRIPESCPENGHVLKWYMCPKCVFTLNWWYECMRSRLILDWYDLISLCGSTNHKKGWSDGQIRFWYFRDSKDTFSCAARCSSKNVTWCQFFIIASALCYSSSKEFEESLQYL